MKYSLIEIRPNLQKRGWYVVHSNLKFNRMKEENPPSPMGFYHYPLKMGKKKAFEELKKAMVLAHVDQIAKLSKSLKSLIELELKD
jgi:hypothetical protein